METDGKKSVWSRGWHRQLGLAGAMALMLTLLGACAASRPPDYGDVALMDTKDASPPPQPGAPEAAPPYDPFEPLNEKVLTVDEKFDDWLLWPAAQAYSKVVPPPARAGITRFFKNVGVLPRFANDVLQFRFVQAGTEASRFGINSTLGLLGFYDPAQNWFGLRQVNNDFGLTLAKYGVGEGPYVMLPVFGPSTVRDTIGKAADGAMNPISYLAPATAVYYQYAAEGFQAVNQRAQEEPLIKQIDQFSLDKYGAIQDAYLQRRHVQEAEVRNAGLQLRLFQNSDDQRVESQSSYDW
jgi:phospholipid-binding lipoprotein MlaA